MDLADEIYPRISERRKEVTVSITRTPRYRKYILPVFGAIIGTIVTVFIASLIMLTKRFGRDHEDNLKAGRVPKKYEASRNNLERDLIVAETEISGGDIQAGADVAGSGDDAAAAANRASGIDGDIEDLKKRCIEALPKESTRFQVREKKKLTKAQVEKRIGIL